MSTTTHPTTAPAQGPSAREARTVAEAARQTEWTKPSFGKELFLGRLRLDLIEPWPTPSAAARAKGESYLTRVDEVCRRIDGARIEREARVPDETFAELAEIGAFGMKVPESQGGQGLTQYYFNKALTLIGSASPAVSAMLSAHQSIGVPQPVKMFGTASQQEAYLPRVAAGEVSAFLLTEPDVGSDPARLATTATPDGDFYVLDGLKLWATNGTIASLFIVLARVPATPGSRGGITAFVVEADSPGITVERRNAFVGLRGIENALIRFHQVRVPAANVVGQVGKGLKIALATLNTGRLSLPAMCVGAAKWSLHVARGWAGERVQWGSRVGDHEAVATKIAFIAASTYGMESMLDLASMMADDDSNDIRIEAALVKLYASEMAWRIIDDLVQIRGGRGYETADSLAARGERPAAVEQLMRDIRINRIFEGSTEIMHLLIAREAVDVHLEVAGEIIDPEASTRARAEALARASAFYAKWLPMLVVGAGTVPGSFREHGPLAEHLRYVERAARRLARGVFAGMARWQGRLEHRQAYLGRIVDIGAELFAMSASCVRATAEKENNPEGVELAGAFCEQARVRVDALFGALWHNSDRSDRHLARRVLDGHHTGLEDGVVHVADDLPWVAAWEPGPAAVPDVRRRIPGRP
ncbi:acyl-CoA dehydrogenase family protein [Tessaracoccus sp. ZS01]|uniref:acyl-CoA dehydrogenase family protein n=1 Tax=Tessaracoccus sp. ZS01 TaxID=1906324 RepID=UPI00096FD9B1|nr:acyl-CoA dehydrogenase family protein [Tessaracoccus sp. ZS01]MCG6567720.1 acyl-CoA dehydrogenase [Tessaracoccus sp. ZS01]OMG55790.1 acyl-CoA dehydrogenase [Tessaracoccus sp. ZS01]